MQSGIETLSGFLGTIVNLGDLHTPGYLPAPRWTHVGNVGASLQDQNSRHRYWEADHYLQGSRRVRWNLEQTNSNSHYHRHCLLWQRTDQLSHEDRGLSQYFSTLNASQLHQHQLLQKAPLSVGQHWPALPSFLITALGIQGSSLTQYIYSRDEDI